MRVTSMRRACALLCGAVLLAASAAGARDLDGIEVRDLHYGEVLFHFYQQEDFRALTHLLTARSAGKLPRHDADSELLLGGLYLAYGQHGQAEEIFQRLLDESVEAPVRDRAWFYLGKVRYHRSLYAQAEAALNKVEGELPEGLAAEHRLLLAQSLIHQARFDEAAETLERWRGPRDWTAYARYNLGVALVRNGQLELGTRALRKVGDLPDRKGELRDLRDQANLALGYAYLQAGEASEARNVLRRVSLHGPFSNKALLGVGWADAQLEDYRDALVPWLELRDRDLLDGAVQEALLAVPYAFGRLEAHGSSVDHYLDALAAFDAEVVRLRNATDRARSGELIPALLQTDDPGIGRWYWQLEQVPDNDDARYLYHLVADHVFQDGLRNVRDLLALGEHLREWEKKLVAFRDMVDTRAEAYAQRLPVVAGKLMNMDLKAIRAERDAQMSAWLAAGEPEPDVTSLATATELDQWERLVSMEESPAWQTAEAAEARSKQRVLKGLLLWQLDREHKLRHWQQRQAIASLDEALSAAEAGTASAVQVRDGIPRELKAFRLRLDRLEERLGQMQLSVRQALGGQEERLQLMAIRSLDEQRERLATYRIQARFALANIYDRANATAARQETDR